MSRAASSSHRQLAVSLETTVSAYPRVYPGVVVFIISSDVDSLTSGREKYTSFIYDFLKLESQSRGKLA